MARNIRFPAASASRCPALSRSARPIRPGQLAGQHSACAAAMPGRWPLGSARRRRGGQVRAAAVSSTLSSAPSALDSAVWRRSAAFRRRAPGWPWWKRMVQRAGDPVGHGGAVQRGLRRSDLQQYRPSPEHLSRSDRTALHLPDTLGGVVEAMLGLDNRPAAQTHFRVRPQEQRRGPAAATSLHASRRSPSSTISRRGPAKGNASPSSNSAAARPAPI